MELENHKEELMADKLAEQFSNKLFVSKKIGVMQANSVHLQEGHIVTAFGLPFHNRDTY